MHRMASCAINITISRGILVAFENYKKARHFVQEAGQGEKRYFPLESGNVQTYVCIVRLLHVYD